MKWFKYIWILFGLSFIQEVRAEMLFFEACDKQQKNAYYILALDTTNMEGWICAINWYDDIEYYYAQINFYYPSSSYYPGKEMIIQPIEYKYVYRESSELFTSRLTPRKENADFTIRNNVIGNWKKIKSHIMAFDLDKVEEFYQKKHPSNYVYLFPEKLERKKKIDMKKIPERYRDSFKQ